MIMLFALMLVVSLYFDNIKCSFFITNIHIFNFMIGNITKFIIN